MEYNCKNYDYQKELKKLFIQLDYCENVITNG